MTAKKLSAHLSKRFLKKLHFASSKPTNFVGNRQQNQFGPRQKLLQ